MKQNWIKYAFIIFVVVIIIFSIYKIRKDEEEKQIQNYHTSENEERITEIRLGIANLDTINPILSNNKNVQNVYKLIYEPLVNITSNYKAEPCLAKEWAKQEDNSMLIKLRENVRWTNGEVFTSRDVKFTIDRLKDANTIYSANVQNVTGVNIIDDYTITIHLDSDIPFFEYNLTFPILSSYYYEGEDFATTEKNKNPVSTGEFKITESEPSYITLEKNTSWWNKEKDSIIQKITINLYSSIGELYNGFKIGRIDLISTENDNVQEYIGTIGYSSKELKGRNHTFLALNTANNLLQKQEIRKAIAYSIDRAGITTQVFNNKYLTSSFPLDYGNWLCQEQDTSSGYNAEQAKQILAEAGWKFTGGMWQKQENYTTQKIALNLLVKASDAEKVAVAENIKAQLATQGIVIIINSVSDEQYSHLISTKGYDIAICGITLSPSPNLDLFFGEGNLANYSTEELNLIMSEVKNTTDEKNLIEKYKKLAEIYKTEMPYISLYNNKYTVAYSSELVGEITPTWFNQFYGIEGWYK